MTHSNLRLARFVPLALATALALSSAAISAATAVSNIVGGTSFPAFNGTNQTVGWGFTVDAGDGVTVSALGWFDPSADTPLSQSHQVGIWTAAGVLVRSVTVETDSSFVDGFRYAATTPFILAGSTSYLIGGAITSPFTDPYTAGASSFVLASGLSFNGSARSGSSSGFTFPDTVTLGNGRFGPNFVFTPNVVNAIPEPSTYALMIAGLGLVGVARLRRKTAAA